MEHSKFEQMIDNAKLISMHFGILERDEMQALFDLEDEVAHDRTQTQAPA